jgi:hypothetical protein
MGKKRKGFLVVKSTHVIQIQSNHVRADYVPQRVEQLFLHGSAWMAMKQSMAGHDQELS